MSRQADSDSKEKEPISSGRQFEEYVPTTYGEDAFDLLGSSNDPYGLKKKKAQNPFNPQPVDPNKGGFREAHIKDASSAALVDGRLSRFLEMGFTVTNAERALKESAGDMDKALSLLLKGSP